MDVDVRRQDGHEDLVRAARELRHLPRVERGGRIDDDVCRAVRRPQLEAARGAAVLLERGDGVHPRLSGLPLLHPTHRGALWVVVHQDRHLLMRGKVAREIDRNGRLPGAPLGVQDDDALHGSDFEWAAEQEYVSVLERRKLQVNRTPRAHPGRHFTTIVGWCRFPPAISSADGDSGAHEVSTYRDRVAVDSASRGVASIASEKSRTPGAKSGSVECITWNVCCFCGMSSTTWPAPAATSPLRRRMRSRASPCPSPPSPPPLGRACSRSTVQRTRC